MSRQAVGIISEVGYGLRDVGRPCLWFTLKTGESTASLQVLFGADAEKVMMDAKIRDVRDLNGRACYYEEDGNLIKFIRVWAA